MRKFNKYTSRSCTNQSFTSSPLNKKKIVSKATEPLLYGKHCKYSRNTGLIAQLFGDQIAVYYHIL